MSTRNTDSDRSSGAAPQAAYPRTNGYHPPAGGPAPAHDPGTVIEFGGRDPGGGSGGRLDRVTLGGPIVRGAGIGCAVTGFALLVASQLLPWQSTASPVTQQGFPIGDGGRTQTGVAQLTVTTDMLSLGWLLILGAVAAALVVAGPARRIVVAVGTGLVAGQLALLAGVAYGIAHTTVITTYRGAFFSRSTPASIEIGVYCAIAAAAVLGLALLLAGGVPRRIRDAEAKGVAPEAGPADLTVTPIPADAADSWRRDTDRDTDIDVSGRYLDR